MGGFGRVLEALETGEEALRGACVESCRLRQITPFERLPPGVQKREMRAMAAGIIKFLESSGCTEGGLND